MKIKINILIAIVLYTSFASASLVNFNFDNIQSTTIEIPGLIYTDSVVFQIQTNQRVLCRYSDSPSIPFNSMTGSFDDNFETIHKKVFTDLSDKVYKYYVRCRDIDDLNNASSGIYELKAIFTISSPIAGQILMDESLLRSGMHEINLITTKIPISTPKLSYSYDSISYKPIILQGSQYNWKGYLIVGENDGEKVGTFKFEAQDLEGRTGNKIVGENIFIIDTQEPQTPSNLEARGEYSRIELKWYLESYSDVEKINIYRSESPNVEITDLYDDVDSLKDTYEDKQVSSGKTYYYKVAAEDSAGNIADLSFEAKATALSENTTSSTKTTLSFEFLGDVEAFLTELDILSTDIQRAQSSIDSKEEIEKAELKILGVTDSIQSANSELSALRREVENFKLQDLTLEVLEAKISSSRLKLNLIKKKVPDSINEIDKIEKIQPLNEEIIRIAALDYAPQFTTSQIDKRVRESLELVEDSNLKITTSFKSFDIIYLDGTKSSRTLIQHKLGNNLEASPLTKLLLKLPQGSIGSTSLNFKNTNYVAEKDNLISFDTDTKEITYQINKKLGSEIIEEITVSPFVDLEESPSITGYFLSDIPSKAPLGKSFLVLIAISLLSYLYYMKRHQNPDNVSSFLDKAKTVKSLQKSGEPKKASQLYESLKLDYISLTNEEKSKVFKKIKKITLHQK